MYPAVRLYASCRLLAKSEAYPEFFLNCNKLAEFPVAILQIIDINHNWNGIDFSLMPCSVGVLEGQQKYLILLNGYVNRC